MRSVIGSSQSKQIVNDSKTNCIILGTSHLTNKYIDVNEQCDGDDIDSSTSITFHNKEKITKRKINVILDTVMCHKKGSILQSSYALLSTKT